MMSLLSEKLDAAEALKDFEGQLDNSGAVASFVGYVRPKGRKGDVKQLMLQAYSPLTEDNITATINRTKEKWDLEDVRVLHRIGYMKPGDAIVFVAAASIHRRAALEAVDYLMDHLKTQAIFWKKEITDTDTIWIEPRAEDYSDHQRWKEKD